MVRIALLSLVLLIISCSCSAREAIVPTAVMSLQKETFAAFYKRIPTIKFPFKYSYDFIIDLPETIIPSEEAMPLIATFVDKETDLSNCHVAKLPSADNTHLLLIFANNRVGEGRFFLCALDSKYRLTDKLLIYTAKNIQWKGGIENCYIDYTIMGDKKIILRKVIAIPDKNILIKKSNYLLLNGKFRSDK